VEPVKVIWGINVPFASDIINWDATAAMRKDHKEITGEEIFDIYVTTPCIRIHKEMSFAVCDICGTDIPAGRRKQGITTCSPPCNKIKNERWALETIEKEKKTAGARPYFFWPIIREECFKRDGYACQYPGCGKGPEKKTVELKGWDNEKKDFVTVGTEERVINPALEAHHIIPICEGGTNEISNLISLCPEHHKKRHVEEETLKKKNERQRVERIQQENKSLSSFGVPNA